MKARGLDSSLFLREKMPLCKMRRGARENTSKTNSRWRLFKRLEDRAGQAQATAKGRAKGVANGPLGGENKMTKFLDWYSGSLPRDGVLVLLVFS